MYVKCTCACIRHLLCRDDTARKQWIKRSLKKSLLSLPVHYLSPHCCPYQKPAPICSPGTSQLQQCVYVRKFVCEYVCVCACISSSSIISYVQSPIPSPIPKPIPRPMHSQLFDALQHATLKTLGSIGLGTRLIHYRLHRLSNYL